MEAPPGFEPGIRDLQPAKCRGHLHEAWRLFQAMGADGALRRMKRDYGDLLG